MHQVDVKKYRAKKLDGNYTRMLQDILNKSWKHHHTKQQLYGHWLPISEIIQLRWARHAGHYWWSKDKLLTDVIQWTLTNGHASVGRLARTYLHQLCARSGCSLEDQPRGMDGMDGWWKTGKSMLAARINHDADFYWNHQILVSLFVFFY